MRHRKCFIFLLLILLTGFSIWLYFRTLPDYVSHRDLNVYISKKVFAENDIVDLVFVIKAPRKRKLYFFTESDPVKNFSAILFESSDFKRINGYHDSPGASTAQKRFLAPGEELRIPVTGKIVKTDGKHCSLEFPGIGKFEDIKLDNEYKLIFFLDILKPRYFYDSMEDCISSSALNVKIESKNDKK